MKIALVTGGTGGIGKAICSKLSENGYHIYINYQNSAIVAEELAAEIGGTALKFDVSNKVEVTSAIQTIIKNNGKLDLLVNNAGVSEINLFTAISEENSDKILNVNLKGTLNCSRAVLPEMIKRKEGCIINISSMWGQCGASCEVDYSASKAGIIGLTKALAKEVGPSGIRVNCVSPGFILTKMNNGFSESEINDILDEIPLCRFGEPNDVAEAVEFLSSTRASFITGQILAVNGGMVI